MLVARGKILSQQMPEGEVLVLCFNVALATYLRGVLAACDKVSVYHFDGWAKANRIVRRRSTDTNSSITVHRRSTQRRCIFF
jgi:hypothetical protein